MYMKMKKLPVTHPILALLFILASLIAGFIPVSDAYAQTQAEAIKCYQENNGKKRNELLSDGACKVDQGGNCEYFDDGVHCSTRPGVAPSSISESLNDPEKCVKQEDLSFNWGVSCVSTAGLINVIFNVLAGLVGVAVVAGITWGGMLYTTSNGNAAKAQQGITVIVNSVIGLLIFIFLFAITNFLVPGGIFKG